MFVIATPCGGDRCNKLHRKYLAKPGRNDDMRYNTCCYCRAELGDSWCWSVETRWDQPCWQFATEAEALAVVWNRGLKDVEICEVGECYDDDKGEVWEFAAGGWSLGSDYPGGPLDRWVKNPRYVDQLDY